MGAKGDGKTDGAVDRQTRKGVVRREVETGRTIVPKPDTLSHQPADTFGIQQGIVLVEQPG